ncbi:ABC transporter ATP-binding protein [Spirillospora sp. NPDC048911]|uniref:ABC transporter ATP-binding protein n=1 Tax=Spirillospora sp. NPDC048911 TaxID=3364527 RepID=UPI003719D87F
MLEVRGLTAGYGRVLVVWDVDLNVGEREIVALIGPNGAGKTTLLRALSGVIPLASGSAVLADRPLGGRSIEAIAGLGIAHVPEGRRLFPGLTVRQNLLLGGWRHRKGGATEIGRVLELFPQLASRLNQVAGSMSGGEQQMCAIARGLMSRPRLMMIDELSLGLAPIVVDEIVARLPAIAADGTAVLLVEQDVDTALSLASRAYVLETGRIALDGPAADLLADSRVQESYLGITPPPRA